MSKSTGDIIRKELQVEAFPNSYIQRVINSSLPLFIVTVDSRFPGKFIGYARLRTMKSTVLRSFSNRGGTGEMEEFRLTPPIDLRDFHGVVPGRSIFVRRDLAGEYFLRDYFYEERTGKINEHKITIYA